MIAVDLYADLSMWAVVFVSGCAAIAVYLIHRAKLHADLRRVVRGRLVDVLDDEEAALEQRRKDRAA